MAAMTSGESPPAAGQVQGGLTEDEKRENLIRLAFAGQTDRYEQVSSRRLRSDSTRHQSGVAGERCHRVPLARSSAV